MYKDYGITFKNKKQYQKDVGAMVKRMFKDGLSNETIATILALSENDVSELRKKYAN